MGPGTHYVRKWQWPQPHPILYVLPVAALCRSVGVAVRDHVTTKPEVLALVLKSTSCHTLGPQICQLFTKSFNTKGGFHNLRSS